jgi:hypothetical protein
LSIRLIINDKTIWDNIEFENILLSKHYEPRNYLPANILDEEFVSVGGWKISRLLIGMLHLMTWRVIINCQGN